MLSLRPASIDMLCHMVEPTEPRKYKLTRLCQQNSIFARVRKFCIYLLYFTWLHVLSLNLVVVRKTSFVCLLCVSKTRTLWWTGRIIQSRSKDHHVSISCAVRLVVLVGGRRGGGGLNSLVGYDCVGFVVGNNNNFICTCITLNLDYSNKKKR